MKTYYKPESLVLTEEVRKSHTDGKYIALPSGITHYKDEGEGENYVVLVHGYATPLFIYDKIAASLVKAGYHVLRYDLFGRGLSDRVDTTYTAEFLAEQLREFVSALIPGKEFDLVATSMGGIIVTTYIAKFDPPVKSLTLLAPAGMNFRVPLPMRLAKIHGLGEILFVLAKGRQERACASEMVKSGEKTKEDYCKKFSYYAQYKGLRKSTLSSLRHTLLDFEKSHEGYYGVAKKGFPVLIIWGTNDKTMPYYQSTEMKKIIPRAKLITYEGSGHIFLYDEGERTSADILDFIKK